MNVLYKNPLFKNLSPYLRRDSQTQVASKLRTLGYPSFRGPVRIVRWVEVVSLWLGLFHKPCCGGSWARFPLRIQIFGGPNRGLGVGVGKSKNELVSDTALLPGGRQGWGVGLGVGVVGGRGWQGQKRIRGSSRQGWGWGWGQGGQRQNRNRVRHSFVFAGGEGI